MDTVTKILSTQSLTVGYENILIDSLNLDVFEGELIGIIGENGSGKSTLINTLCRLNKPLNGTAFIKDKQIKDYSGKQLAEVMSIVITDKVETKALRVEELVALGRRAFQKLWYKQSSDDNILITKALKVTKTEHLKHKMISSISDGEYQRVMIAKAIVQDTPMILLDEPTTHLDFKNKVNIFNLLRKLCDEFKKTILFSSHEIEYCLKICDKMLLIDKQKTILDTPKSLVGQQKFISFYQKDKLVYNPQERQFYIR